MFNACKKIGMVDLSGVMDVVQDDAHRNSPNPLRVTISEVRTMRILLNYITHVNHPPFLTFQRATIDSKTGCNGH